MVGSSEEADLTVFFTINSADGHDAPQKLKARLEEEEEEEGEGNAEIEKRRRMKRNFGETKTKTSVSSITPILILKSVKTKKMIPDSCSDKESTVSADASVSLSSYLERERERGVNEI